MASNGGTHSLVKKGGLGCANPVPKSKVSCPAMLSPSRMRGTTITSSIEGLSQVPIKLTKGLQDQLVILIE
jgi:hypothetical protein